MDNAQWLKGYQQFNKKIKFSLQNFCVYRTHAKITSGIYTFYSMFEGQKRFSRSFVCKILTLCMVSVQDRFIISSYG